MAKTTRRSPSTLASSPGRSTRKGRSTEERSPVSEAFPSDQTSQITFGEQVGLGPTESRKVSNLSTPKPKLELGKWYRVEVTIKGASGGPGYSIPTVRVNKVMQLLDKRSNGVLIMQHKVWTWDRDMRLPGKKAVKKLKLVKIKTSQIKGLVHEEAA